VKISRNLELFLIVITLVASSLSAVLVAAGLPRRAMATTGALHAIEMVPTKPISSFKINAVNPNPPSETVKLIFIHHSTGYNWLDNSNGTLLQALNDNNYYVSDASGGGPYNIGSRTDTGDWYEWFAGPNSGEITDWLYNRSNTRGDNSIPNPDQERENEVIMFKSCYPSSNIWGNPDDPPNDDPDPPRGFAPNSLDHNVANIKRIYIDILEYFETRQDKLFIAITAPPLRAASTDAARAANARTVNNWLVYEWLADYPYHNVTVFDFYNVLTTNGGDADTNDLGWSTGNHHRLITTTTSITVEHKIDGDDDAEPNYLEYPTVGGTNNHPSQAGNRKATGEFVPLLNAYYNCWKYDDCWDDSPAWISVTAATGVASFYPGETATFTLSLAASEGFTTPVTLTLQGAPSGTTVSFDPNPVTPPSISQLHITTTVSIVAGTYTMTVTGTSGQVTDTTSLTLTIKPATINPVLFLTVQPVFCTILPGEAATYTLSLTVTEGSAAPVTLTLQGIPSDAVASFGSNPITSPGTSQLYITTTLPTVAGIYPMTVTGTAGVFTDTANLALTVTTATPSFTLSISPTTRIAKPSQIVSYAAVVTGVNGFSYPVTLTAMELPTDVGATWSVNPVTPDGSSVLTLSIPSSPSFGHHLLQVAGIADIQVIAEGIDLIIAYPFKMYLPVILK